jgi:hypothetical protein
MQKQEQQTAVDTLFAEILELLLFKGEIPEHLKEAHRKAKELENDQHSKTWDASRVGYTGDSFRDSVFGLVKDFSEYYEETYGNNNEQTTNRY